MASSRIDAGASKMFCLLLEGRYRIYSAFYLAADEISVLVVGEQDAAPSGMFPHLKFGPNGFTADVVIRSKL